MVEQNFSSTMYLLPTMYLQDIGTMYLQDIGSKTSCKFLIILRKLVCILISEN
jgi:hypothetical protein